MRKTLPILCLLLLLIFSSLYGTEPSLSVSPSSALVDASVSITVTGLEPRQKVTLDAQTKDYFENIWQSQAVFLADEKGTIDLATNGPFSGSYEGNDPMGLFWSMHSQSEEVGAFYPPKKALIIQLSVLDSAKRKLCSKEITRKLFSDKISLVDVKERGVVGLFCIPEKSTSNVLVITLTGSNGGLSPSRAQLLASHGIPSFALAYFGTGDLPKNLEEIPLEYFEKAFKYLKQNYVQHFEKLVLLGASRGGELALLLASYFPKDVDGVIAYVPSNVIWSGLPDMSKPSWTYQGSPLPFVPPAKHDSATVSATIDLPAETSSFCYASLKQHPEKAHAAQINLQNIQCPLLLISGKDDKMWPSSYFCTELMKHPCPAQRTHLDYDEAGHLIYFPYLPTSSSLYFHPKAKKWFTLGGTPDGNNFASHDSWKKVISFIQNFED